MKATGNTIIITGGGSGIGKALAHRLHDLGNTVIIAGRRLDVLQNAARGRDHIAPMVVDIDDPEAVEAFARQVIKEYPTVNVLINNAGIMRQEKLDEYRDLRDMEMTIVTNLLGPIRLLNALIDHLIQQPHAMIINNTSGLAFVPLASTPTYSASKAALHSYTVALREALKGKVEVVELVPPALQTNLTPGQETKDGYYPLDAFIDEAMALLLQQPPLPEVLVKNVHFLRYAESEGRFEQTVALLADKYKAE